MKIEDLILKIRRKWMKIRLQPIRVFCFHQVSEEFDESTMWKRDWTQTDKFKQKIQKYEQEYEFISLEEAYHHLVHDKIRLKKYAVLTADDGWASLKNIIPWLGEKKIPVTLFLNPAYLDGEHYPSRETEKLITEAEVKELQSLYPSLISIASHGWRHDNVRQISIDQYMENISKAEEALKDFDNKINFYAFTYGACSYQHVVILQKMHIIPVLVEGSKNYKFDGVIHRECIDN